MPTQLSLTLSITTEFLLASAAEHGLLKTIPWKVEFIKRYIGISSILYIGISSILYELIELTYAYVYLNIG